jgi:hypothetical protein
MKRTISRLAAAAVFVAATTGVVSRQASGQDSRGSGAGAGSSGSTSFDRTTDARELTTGLTLGVYSLAATGISISGPDVEGTFKTKLGEGGGLVAGYGFSRTFSAYVSLDVAKQATAPHTHPTGTFGLAHFEIGGRANIPMGGARTTPYVSASVGNRALAANVYSDNAGENVDFSMSGQVFVLGGGVQHFISPHAALDAGVELATGKFNHFSDNTGKYDMQLDNSSSVRVRVGVNWRP